MARKLTKKQKRNRILLILALIIFASGLFIGYIVGRRNMSWSDLPAWWGNWRKETKQQPAPQLPNFSASSKDQLHILDVGQGSATLIQSADGHNILIDSGRHDDGKQRIIRYLDEFIGTGGKIDLLIFTHTDSDHIGHGDLILDYYQVEEVWMNDVDNTTRTYFKLLEAIDRSKANYLEPKAGHSSQLGSLNIEIWHPFPDKGTSDQNEGSLMGRVSLPSYSVVFSGDATYYREDEVLEYFSDVQADYVIAGHHGAHDSTGRNWLNAIRPRAVFYSAGYQNMYGHPHDELVYRVQDEGIPLYGTDYYGTMSLIFDQNGEVHFEADYPNGRENQGVGEDAA